MRGEEAANEAVERRRLHNAQEDRRNRLQQSTARHAHRAPAAQANGQRIQAEAERRALEQRRLEALPPCAHCGRRRHRCLARMIESSLRNFQLPPHAVARPSDSLLRISNRNRTARAILFTRATTLLHGTLGQGETIEHRRCVKRLIRRMYRDPNGQYGGHAQFAQRRANYNASRSDSD